MATLTKRDFLGENCPSVRTVERWYLQLWLGSFVLDNQLQTGRPSDVATPELVDAVRTTTMLLRNLRAKVVSLQTRKCQCKFENLNQSVSEWSLLFY